MFGSKEKCAICGEGLSKGTAVQLQDGSLCPMCNRISQKSIMRTVDQVKQAWKENHDRFQTFTQTMAITDFGSGYIFVDNQNQLCYIANSKKIKQEPVVFKFSEIEEFRIEQVGQKTITKTKGGVGRAIVGGALFGGAGAIVGATTAKQETKQVAGIPILYVELCIGELNTTVSIARPPLKTASFFESVMDV